MGSVHPIRNTRMLFHSTPRGLGRWDSAAKTVPPFHALGFGTLERRGQDRSAVPRPGVWNAGTARPRPFRRSTPWGLERWNGAARGAFRRSTPWGLERWNGAAKTVPPFHALGFGTLERRGQDRSAVPRPGVWNAGTARRRLSRSAPKVHARIDAHPWMQRRWRVSADEALRRRAEIARLEAGRHSGNQEYRIGDRVAKNPNQDGSGP